MVHKQKSQPPKPGATLDEWQEYALEFDGYEHAGGAAAAQQIYAEARARILAGEPVRGTTDTLRTVLFVHQRRYRLLEAGPEALAVEQRVADAILAELQRAA